MRSALFLAALLFTAPAMGQEPFIAKPPQKTQGSSHLGVHGNLWEIQEEDAVDYMKRRAGELVKDGTVAKMQKEGAEKVINSILHQKPVPGISTATGNRTWEFDPSVPLSRDIRDASGRLIFPAGTMVNPLKYGGLSKRFIFIDARDSAQVDFAVAQKQANPRDAVILVGGDWVAVSKRIDTQAYYDQAGELSRRFGLSRVPAIVSQAGYRLKIEEVAVGKDVSK